MRTEDDTDERLLRRVARADRAAFEELYRRNAGWLALRLRRRCGDPELAAEVLQDTFLTVWRSATGFTRDGAAAGWLWSVASSRLVDTFRHKKVRIQPSGEPSEVALTTHSAEIEVMNRSLSATMTGALERLSPELRAVLQATILDGLTTRETSVLLGIPEGTVKTRARKARSILQEALT